MNLPIVIGNKFADPNKIFLRLHKAKLNLAFFVKSLDMSSAEKDQILKKLSRHEAAGT